MKKLKRREKQSQIRQALLINEYIQTKYFGIYQEAACYYNELNASYPSRPDLRKADEFRAWKRCIKGEPIMSIEIEIPVETSNETPTETPVEASTETSTETPVETSTETSPEISLVPRRSIAFIEIRGD